MKKLNRIFITTAAAITLSTGLLATTAKGQDGSGMKPASVNQTASASKRAMKPKMKTVEGILVDSKCYEKSIALHMPHPNVGVNHMTPNGEVKDCAIKCARMGVPVAILENDGTLLILTAPSKPFAKDMAKRVRVTGMTPFAGSIVPVKVEVQSADGSWKQVQFTTMM